MLRYLKNRKKTGKLVINVHEDKVDARDCQENTPIHEKKLLILYIRNFL